MEQIHAELKSKIEKIKAIVTDADGVLTDGSLFITEDGNEPLSRFSIYDGYGVVIAHQCNIKIIVISGRKSACTEARCLDLGIDIVHTGVRDKRQKLIEIASELQLELAEMIYIGDDIIDLQAMSVVGVAAAPQNAVEFVKEQVDYVTIASGGSGVLREIIELILKVQGRYIDHMQTYL